MTTEVNQEPAGAIKKGTSFEVACRLHMQCKLPYGVPVRSSPSEIVIVSCPGRSFCPGRRGKIVRSRDVLFKRGAPGLVRSAGFLFLLSFAWLDLVYLFFGGVSKRCLDLKSAVRSRYDSR